MSDQDFVTAFLIEIARAADTDLEAAVADALARIGTFWGVSQAFLLRQRTGPDPVLVQQWPPAVFPRMAPALSGWTGSDQPTVEIDGQKVPALVTLFGTDADGGILVLLPRHPGATSGVRKDAPTKPVLEGLLALLKRREKILAPADAPSIFLQDQWLDVFDTLEVGMILHDSANRFVTCNTQFRDFYPNAHDHPGVKNLQSDSHTPERVLPDGRTLQVTRRRMPDGGSVETYSDITSLRMAEQRLRNVVDGARICTWEWNVKTGEHKVNEYWAELLGYKLEELTPITFETWRKRVHPDDLKAVEDLFEGAISDDGITYLIEYRLRHKDGHWIWVLDSGRTLYRGPAGTPELVVGVQVNISDQKAREAALATLTANLERSIAERAHVEQRLFDIATVSDGWLWEMDQSCRYSFVLDGEFFNDGGVAPDQMIGKTQKEWLAAHPDMLADIEWDILLETLEAHKPFRDFIYRAPIGTDGVIRWRRMTGKPVFDQTGLFSGYRGVGSDITELYLAKKKAEEASRTKSMFLANMSHEIRTPLNGVLGMAEVLDNALSNPEDKRMIGIIRQSGESLLSVLNDILDMSKIEAGKLELENVALDMADIVRGIEDLHALNAHAKGIHFDVTLDTETYRARTGDPHRVRQVLHNLVSNAIKFTEKGGVTVKITAPSGKPLSIEVTDTGIGMTPAQVAVVHDEFGQADVSITRRFGGTGLGMGITRNLVKMMSGTIKVDSAPDQGTRVRITLPLPESDRRSIEVLEPRPELINLQNIRILAADDNATNRAVLEAMLTRRGATVMLVSNGAEAIQKWSAAAFDAVLLDIAMPVMDGPTALDQIRILEARTGRPRTPVVAVTANAMSHQISDYLIMGFDSCVAKPLNSHDLAYTIGYLIAEMQDN